MKFVYIFSRPGVYVYVRVCPSVCLYVWPFSVGMQNYICNILLTICHAGIWSNEGQESMFVQVFFGGKIFFLGNLSSPITSCFTQKDNWSLLMLCWRHFVCVCNFSERDCTNYKGTWTGTELPSSVNFPCLANKIHNFFSDWYLLNSERLLVFW